MSEMMNETNSAFSLTEKMSDLLIFVPCFVLLLVVALLGQMVGIHWRKWLSGAEDSQNIFIGIKSAVFTFMSHIN